MCANILYPPLKKESVYEYKYCCVQLITKRTFFVKTGANAEEDCIRLENLIPLTRAEICASRSFARQRNMIIPSWLIPFLPRELSAGNKMYCSQFKTS